MQSKYLYCQCTYFNKIETISFRFHVDDTDSRVIVLFSSKISLVIFVRYDNDSSVIVKFSLKSKSVIFVRIDNVSSDIISLFDKFKLTIFGRDYMCSPDIMQFPPKLRQ